MNDQPKPDHAIAFTQMAERIRKNEDESFGGAFVIVPPLGAGQPLQLLMLSATNPADFWIMLKGQIQAELDALNAPPNPYGRR